MIISQTSEEIKSALALQSKVDLVAVALRECHASSTTAEGHGFTKPFRLHMAHTSSANPVASGLLRIENRFRVQGVDSSDPPVQIFGIECSFGLDYQIKDPAFEPKGDSISAFKDGNAVFNCWPYTREFIQNMASRMSINTPPLPLLRIMPSKSEAREPANTQAPDST